MGKQQPKQLPQRDQYARLSHLYQSANLLATSNPALAQMYSKTMIQIARKNVIKISPTIKRRICKSCSALLTPGVTSKSEIVNPAMDKKNNKNSERLEITCTKCQKIKRFPLN